MRFFEIANNITFYHGSMKRLSVGTILSPRNTYEDTWGNTEFYNILKMYKPNGMLGHNEGVFMVSSEEDIDLAGGGTEWMFIVEPLGKIQKHDLNWSSEISMLISDGKEFDDEEVMNAARSYWNGEPHPNESVWEFITPKAKIISVERY